MSNVLTISETGYKKAYVKMDNFWDVAGNSIVIKNNNKDRITLLVIIILSKKGLKISNG